MLFNFEIICFETQTDQCSDKAEPRMQVNKKADDNCNVVESKLLQKLA